MLDLLGLGSIGTYLMMALAVLGALFGVYKSGARSEKRKQTVRNLETYVEVQKRARAAQEVSDAKTDADPGAVDERLREHGALRD
jgi:hypothetical protein